MILRIISNAITSLARNNYFSVHTSSVYLRTASGGANYRWKCAEYVNRKSVSLGVSFVPRDVLVSFVKIH